MWKNSDSLVKVKCVNPIAGFFDHEYLWEQCINFFDMILLHDMGPDMTSHAQTSLELPEIQLVQNNSEWKIRQYIGKLKHFFYQFDTKYALVK